MDIHNLIIIGGGPAGLTAAIYAARAGYAPLVLAGLEPGGQLMLTTEVENYPGFVDGIMGPDLMLAMRAQAERFGAVVKDESATAVDFSGDVHMVTAGETVYQAHAVVLATGASALWLGLESEKRLRGKGVSSCATCDGFFFRGKEIAVIGGGDTAMEEATFLTKFATKVSVIYRGKAEDMRASKAMLDKALANPKITFIYNTVVDEVLGQDKVEGLRLRQVETGQVSDLAVAGMFVAIGHKPNTEILSGIDGLVLNPKGYIVPESETKTAIPGVFVAGDVFDATYRQAVTAAASGCKAALDAQHYLEAQRIEPV